MKAIGALREAGDFLSARLQALSAESWQAVSREAFSGSVTVLTANTRYEFEGARLTGRTSRAGHAAPIAGGPSLRLVGFLSAVGALWSFSTAWTSGASCVLIRDGGPGHATFFVTSGTVAFEQTRATPRRRTAPCRALGARTMPPPPSLTRVVAAPPR